MSCRKGKANFFTKCKIGWRTSAVSTSLECGVMVEISVCAGDEVSAEELQKSGAGVSLGSG